MAHSEVYSGSSVLVNTDEFEDLLNRAVQQMNDQAKAGMPGYSNSSVFEDTVLAQLRVCCQGVAGAEPSFHDSAFPDIIVNGFGVEVKFTTRPTWHGTGNSIFEGMRDHAARQICVVYCRSDIPETRWRWYESCIKGIRISHSPRYVIDMDGDVQFFSELGITMEEFREIDLRTKMALVKNHVKQRVGDGERLWWFDEEQEHTVAVNVRLYRLLDQDTKETMRAEAALMCPQIFRGSRQRGKYDDAALYLLTQHGVFAPQTRDLFSAGSVAGARRGGDYLIRAIQNNAHKIEEAAGRLDDVLFEEYWGESCPPENRISRWLELADGYRPNNPPSKMLIFG